MEKKAQIVVAISVIVAFLIGLSVGQWYAGYRIERQVDKVTENWQDYMDNLSGRTGVLDDTDIIDISDLDDLTHDVINNMPVPYNDIFCDYDGQSILAGDTYYDGCNWCSCQDDGLMLCTERACEGMDTSE